MGQPLKSVALFNIVILPVYNSGLYIVQYLTDCFYYLSNSSNFMFFLEKLNSQKKRQFCLAVLA